MRKRATTGGEEVANEHFWAKRIFPDAKHHKTKVEVSSVAVISFAKHLSTQTHTHGTCGCRWCGGRGCISSHWTLTQTVSRMDWNHEQGMREVWVPVSARQVSEKCPHVDSIREWEPGLMPPGWRGAFQSDNVQNAFAFTLYR